MGWDPIRRFSPIWDSTNAGGYHTSMVHEHYGHLLAYHGAINLVQVPETAKSPQLGTELGTDLLA